MSLLESIGNTPLVEIKKLVPNQRVRVLAKLEGNNPGGSVKDRIAYYMIKQALASGLLKQDKIVLEPTSGNTGIGLAMICAVYGLKAKLTMPQCVSVERRRVLEAFGAELVLTPGPEGTDGAIQEAHRIFEQAPELYFMPDQFRNQANPLAHYETTGREVWEQTKGTVSHFVAGMGTTGTVMGTGRRLKEYSSRIQVIGVEPVKGHRIQGLKNMEESIVPDIYDPKKLDRKIMVNDEQALSTTRRLVLEEGLFVGMSAGAAMYGAMEAAKDAPAGSTIVVIFPDRGDRYLSTSLFTSVCAKCPP
ncbi:MAG: cysteine synthase family protein [Planctomycetota bacterium]